MNVGDLKKLLDKIDDDVMLFRPAYNDGFYNVHIDHILVRDFALKYYDTNVYAGYGEHVLIDKHINQEVFKNHQIVKGIIIF